VELKVVSVEKPEDVNVVLGQAHFIKTVEDLHETVVGQAPGAAFGVAFCEASGPALVRWSGNDAELIALAKRNALALAAGHVFVLMLRNAFPINVMGGLRAVPEVCHVFCATANPVQVVLAETEQGRGVLGVVDGVPPAGVEDEAQIAERKAFLRKIGYKL